MREVEQYSEINTDGVREDQPYLEMQSHEYVNQKDFKDDVYHDDQSDVKTGTARNGRARMRSSGGEETAAVSASTSLAAISATFVALVVVAACIVPAVTDAATDIDIAYVVSGSNEIDFEVTIGHFEGDAMSIFLMEGTSEIFAMEAGNGTFSAAIKGLKPDTPYVLEIRSGIPSLHIIESYEIRTIASVPSVPEATLQYATPGFTSIKYAVTLNDYNEDTDVTVELTQNGSTVHTAKASALAITGMIAGLSPATPYVLTVVDHNGSSVSSWDVVTRDLPTGYFDTIKYNSSAISYTATIDGYQDGDEIDIVVEDMDGNLVDIFRADSDSPSHKVTGLTSGATYKLRIECVGIPISQEQKVTIQTA